MRPVAPTGRDGDDVDMVMSIASLDDFLQRDMLGRRQAILNVLCDALIDLATFRQWDVGPIEAACSSLSGQPIKFVWESRPKSSPDRRFRAQAFGEVRETGGWIRIQVTDRSGRVVTETDEEQLKDNQPREFRIRADRIRWNGGKQVVVEAKSEYGNPPRYLPIVVDIDSE